MTKELREKWAIALRSGKYIQGVGKLESVNGFNCCLGVLCRISGLEAHEAADDACAMDFEYEGESSRGQLPESFADKIKLPALVETRLISMNDNEGKSFDEIADYILGDEFSQSEHAATLRRGFDAFGRAYKGGAQ